jgi:sugar lactone lactonase YvrE/lysophospholipase L1-like esterase
MDMKVSQRFIALGVLLGGMLMAHPAWAQFSNGQAAVGVLGPADLVTRPPAATTASRFNGPNGVALDPISGKLFVADRGNHRVLRWSSAAAMTNGAAAEAVLGQTDFVTGTSGLAANKFNNPIGVHVDGAGRLWVADFSNNRVLRFDDASNKANGASADAVLGQPDFATGSSATSAVKMNGPVNAWLDPAGRLWVVNFNNHRVLRFDDAASKPNGAAADGVLGQPDFTTGASGLGQNRMASPNAVFADAGGRVWVSDYANRRVLRFDGAASKANGANADGVLGQPDFTTNTTGVTQSKFGFTRYVAGDASGRLYVVEEANHRVMIFDAAATLPNGASADAVLGQPNFTTNTAPNPPNAASLATPRAIAVDPVPGNLWLADWANHRVLRYEAGDPGAVTLALSAPNGGEDWAIGTVHAITWTSSNVTAVNLEYSTDAGASWHTIASGVPATPASYAWTIPNAPSAQALVRISNAADPGLADVSAAPFTISVPVATVTLVSPNGLQQWEAGAQRRILFASTNLADVRIEVSDDDGASWSEVVASTPAAAGSYLWTVPAATGNAYRIRVSSATDPLVSDASALAFAVVPEKTGDDFDAVFFSDSPTAVYYDPSFTSVTAPSTLERALTDKCPVSTAYSLVGNYALRLAWTSAAGGDWAMANAGIGWVGRDVTVKDTLTFHVFTETPTAAADLPCIYLEDLSNRKTPKVPLSTLTSDVPAGSWRRISIPVRVFEDDPGTADLTRIKTIFLGQQAADGSPHVWYLDDFRVTGGTPVTGDSTKLIVVLGSSTAAGIGPSTTDSSWVGRYRAYIQSFDPSAVIVNLAIGGYTTYHVMPTGYVPPAGRPSPSPNNNITFALAYKPWAIIVSLPSNDVTNGYPIAEQLANYDTLRARGGLHNVPVWITSGTPRNLADPVQRDQLRILTDSTMARYAPYAIDIYHGLAAADGTILPQYNSGDNIHFNDAGHRVIFDQVVGANVWERICPDVEVTYPNGGEMYLIGIPDSIQWSAANLSRVTGFDVLLSRDGRDGPYEPLGSTSPDRTTFRWTPTGPDAFDTCYVRVDAKGTPGTVGRDESDRPFTIRNPATPVLLAMFTAEPVAGGVEIVWVFGHGSDVVSAQVSRGESMDGPWTTVGGEARHVAGVHTLLDREAPPGREAYYRLSATSAGGETQTFGPVIATARPAVTEFALGRPAPNPTAGPLRVEFALPVAAEIDLSVLDVQGRVLERLASGPFQPGRHERTWNARASVPAGLYFVRFRSSGREFTHRVMLVR